mmetsp:Transcript_9686/g.22025  ORF Transcript_9686/g.22025 Transcript_9686/m.22025 type:complete len:266 (+) Transcript_9686:137-934(+)
MLRRTTIALLVFLLGGAWGFSVSSVRRLGRIKSSTSLRSELDVVNGIPTLAGALEGCRRMQIDLTEHKPLGCSVEESLAEEPNGEKYVFVVDVVEGGNAQKAGIKVGDVIVQITGTFDECVDVSGLGIERVQSLVAGRSKDDVLTLRIARGSDVQQRHVLALVEMCIVGDDQATASCIDAIYAEESISVDADESVCNEDDETECMLDTMWGSWDEGFSESDSVGEAEEEVVVQKKKVMPWSSRSSGSGTFVRDPKTGKMVNIDED